MLQIFIVCVNINCSNNIGASPSGKASDSDSDIPVFESQCPSQWLESANVEVF